MDAKRWSMKSSHEESRERTTWAGTKSYEAAAKLVMKGWKKGRQQLLDNVEAIALKKDLVDMPSSLYDVAGAALKCLWLLLVTPAACGMPIR